MTRGYGHRFVTAAVTLARIAQGVMPDAVAAIEAWLDRAGTP